MRDNILINPNKLLRRKASPIKCNPMDMIRATNMFNIMYKSNGMGLAAPQIGWNARLFVLDIESENTGRLIFVNPEIVEHSTELVDSIEGCLSVPNVQGLVKRYFAIKVLASDIYGKKFVKDLTGLTSKCVQHEIDHFDGILFIDKTEKVWNT